MVNKRHKNQALKSHFLEARQTINKHVNNNISNISNTMKRINIFNQDRVRGHVLHRITQKDSMEHLAKDLNNDREQCPLSMCRD